MGAGICVHICVITWEFIHVILNWVALYPEGMGRGEAYLGKIKVKDSANVFLFQNGGLLICRP